MASRGSLGGLARATANVTRVLDAAGFDVVLIETVGAGQSEVDIARLAQTVLVIEAPNLGDDIQAIKAGILEIADILVVNKADDPRSKHTERALRGMLDIGHKQATMAHHGQLMEAILPPEFNELDNLDFWNVPICLTVATDGSGVNDLLDRIEEHRTHLKASGELDQRTRTRAATELEMLLRDRLLARLLDGMSPEQINGLVDRVARRELLPHLAVEELVNGTRLQMDK
jgi:LAO/AO transport system kinase